MEFTLHLRLPTELGERIDRIKDRLSKTSGVVLTRSMVIRALLEKGAEQYELVKPQVKVKASEPARRAPSQPDPLPEDDKPAEEPAPIMSKKDLGVLGL